MKTTHSALLLLGLLTICSPMRGQKKPPRIPDISLQGGRLTYRTDSHGGRPIDYSYCGYRASADTLPVATPRVRVKPLGDGSDDTPRLQQAIDYVASLPAGADGMRGAVVLEAGTYHLEGRLMARASGIVVRGAGADLTRLSMGGTDRRPAIAIEGIDDRRYSRDTLRLAAYVPLATMALPGGGTLQPGDVEIVRPSTREWIASVGCDIYGGGIDALGWKPGDTDIRWRRVAGPDGRLDAPLTFAFDGAADGAFAVGYTWPGRIAQCGIEDLTIESQYAHARDEQHCWTGIAIDNARDCWVARVNFDHLAGSGVAVQPGAQRITVEDCLYRDPVSEVGGLRRNAFYVMGQQVLVQRCVADHAMHAFAAGYCAPGPNAFVQCEAREALDYSGAIDALATGLLMDIVDIDGHDLMMARIGQDNGGAGWTSASGMCWQCTAAMIHCSSPDSLNVNRAYGSWSQFDGDGEWWGSNDHIQPRSLYYAQLGERLHAADSPAPAMDAALADSLTARGRILPRGSEASSSPTPEVAMRLALEARTTPRLTLEAWVSGIQRAKARALAAATPAVAVKDIGLLARPARRAQSKPSGPAPTVALTHGHLTDGEGRLLTGGRYATPWWNGKLRPSWVARNAQPALTRFVPDREGTGFTDRIDSVVAYMEREDMVVYDQHYGLWYDRRRDDHERIRRRDGQVWAPFYEQPWDRTGEGTAWEGLSRYDLRRPNRWYYDRLRAFAQRVPTRLLFVQHYFQHNILEAGAHWVDCPWRPVNNVNATAFPEPVPFAGDKRVFVAEYFYDESEPTMRALHRQYIRQVLDEMKDCPNAVHSISAEYTGPLHFTRFWVECVAEWERETGLHPLVALAATKDVQDSIMADPELARVIDIIDIRYWFYRQPDKRNPADLWAPLGGLNMAPRQHLRQMAGGKTGFDEAYRSVRECRDRWPDKAVTFYAQNYTDLGWASLMAGGSCPQVRLADPSLRSAIPAMLPVACEGGRALASDASALLYLTQSGPAQVVAAGLKPGHHDLMRIDRRTGAATRVGQASVGAGGACTVNGQANEVYWIR